jgi:hypothetical protein
MALTMISPKIKKRFPTLEHLRHADYLEDEELQIINEFNNTVPDQPTHWLPIVWALNIVKKAHKRTIIRQFCSQSPH